GGKNATSSPSFTVSASKANSWLIAATAEGSDSASVGKSSASAARRSVSVAFSLRSLTERRFIPARSLRVANNKTFTFIAIFLPHIIRYIIATFAAMLFQQANILDAHSPVYGFCHIVYRQGRCTDGC